MGHTVAIAHRLAAQRRSGSLALTGAACAAVTLSATAAALGATARTPDPSANAAVRGLLVAAPMLVGLYAERVHAYARFARLLYATGVVAFVTTLAETRDPALYTAGRAAGWIAELLIVVLILAYPGGRLETRTDRRIAGALGATVVLFYLPTLLLTDTLRVPSPWTSCTSDCPANALSLVDGRPGFVEPLLFAPGTVALAAVMLAVVLRLDQRIRGATRATRRMLVPVLAVGMTRAALLGVGALVRELGSDAVAVQAIAWMLALSVPALSLAFLAGLIRARLSDEQALRRLALVVQRAPDARSLAHAVREALEDPTAEILFPGDATETRWVDATGRVVALPRDDPSRAVHRVVEDDRVAATIVYRAGDPLRPQLVEAAGSLAAIALERERLTAEAESATREVHRSRARIAASAEQERRRIERDLHDGAQQRLVALCIELGLLEDLAQRDPARCAERIQELERSAEEALDELRSLAHGVCPPLLADRGLAEALRAAASRCVTPVRLTTHDIGRYPDEVETAVYFCVLEALQNTDKHARAHQATVELDGGGRQELRFVVHDDGEGAPDAGMAAGAGMTNMSDRIAAVGGHLRVVSSHGLGTTVRGAVPIPVGSIAATVRPDGGGGRGAPRSPAGS